MDAEVAPRFPELLLLVGGVRFSTSQNGALVVLRELVLRAEDCVGVGRVDAVRTAPKIEEATTPGIGRRRRRA